MFTGASFVMLAEVQLNTLKAALKYSLMVSTRHARVLYLPGEQGEHVLVGW